MYHIAWDPFQSVTRSRYQIKNSVLGVEGARLLIDYKRSKRDGRCGQRKPIGPCACMSRTEGDKTTATLVDMGLCISIRVATLEHDTSYGEANTEYLRGLGSRSIRVVVRVHLDVCLSLPFDNCWVHIISGYTSINVGDQSNH